MFLKLGLLPDLKCTRSAGWLFNFARESLSVSNLRFCAFFCRILPEGLRFVEK